MTPSLPRAPLSGAGWFAIEFDPERQEVVMLDQRLLPGEVRYHRYRKPDEVADAIRDMVIRGAPAIGIAAAYALAMVARDETGDAKMFLAGEVCELAPEARYQGMLDEAEAIHREDLASCRRMGELGAADVPDGAVILTHCNAGALATGGYGTALGVVRAAHAAGKSVRVLAGETRPYLQGARLTAWELHQDGIPVEVITDSMAGHFMQRGEVQFIVVGSDRIAANSDTANKIGTYALAVLAHHHEVPFTVAAPWSTVDMRAVSGDDIPIEERPRDEVARIGDTILVAETIECRHPAFDITPARLIDAIYTERGVIRPKIGERPDVLKSATFRGA